MCASRQRTGTPGPGSTGPRTGGIRVIDVVEQWAILEADFARDYGINLTEAVFEEGLAWWRFQALMAGLGFDSIWRAWLRDKPAPPLTGKAAQVAFDLIR